MQPSQTPVETTPENSQPLGSLEEFKHNPKNPDQEDAILIFKKSKWLRIVFYLFVVGVLSVVFWQRLNIIDWWKLRNYTPTVSASQLATNTTMTGLGRKVFYLQKPQIQSKEAFYVSCEEGETTVVLGCYKPINGIYLLKVDDTRLNGVEEVTAAHEMLHAAYDRLSFKERKRIGEIINQYYSGITDKDILDKIDLYKKSGADITNELHSILATEVKDLPTDLEQYYGQYFSDRSKIVSYAVGYKSEFTKRKDKVEELDKQLKGIEDKIISNNQTLDAQQQAINAESKRLDDLRNNGLVDEYNAGVIAYNKSLIPFRSLISTTKGLVTQYKSILIDRNKVAAEAQELNKALDSTKIGSSVEGI